MICLWECGEVLFEVFKLEISRCMRIVSLVLFAKGSDSSVFGSFKMTINLFVYAFNNNLGNPLL